MHTKIESVSIVPLKYMREYFLVGNMRIIEPLTRIFCRFFMKKHIYFFNKFSIGLLLERGLELRHALLRRHFGVFGCEYGGGGGGGVLR